MPETKEQEESNNDLGKMIEICLNELKRVSRGQCDGERAERNAAFFLEVQIKLAEYISVMEFNAKMAKAEVERLSAEKYFLHKGSIVEGKKMTEASLEHAVLKDESVVTTRQNMLKNESEYKKWNYIMGILENGHIFFRGIGKKQN